MVIVAAAPDMLDSGASLDTLFTGGRRNSSSSPPRFFCAGLGSLAEEAAGTSANISSSNVSGTDDALSVSALEPLGLSLNGSGLFIGGPGADDVVSGMDASAEGFAASDFDASADSVLFPAADDAMSGMDVSAEGFAASDLDGSVDSVLFPASPVLVGLVAVSVAADDGGGEGAGGGGPISGLSSSVLVILDQTV